MRLLFVGIYSLMLQGQTQLEVFLPDGVPCEGAVISVHSAQGDHFGFTEANGFFWIPESTAIEFVTATKPGYLGVRKNVKHLEDGQTQFHLRSTDLGGATVLADWIEVPFIPEGQPYCGGGAIDFPMITRRAQAFIENFSTPEGLPMDVPFSANFNRDGTITQVEILDSRVPKSLHPLLEQAIKTTPFIPAEIYHQKTSMRFTEWVRILPSE